MQSGLILLPFYLLSSLSEYFDYNIFWGYSLFHLQSNDAGSFQLATGEKHLSQSVRFPKAFLDRDRWCPFKRSHGSVLFLVLTSHTDTEAGWERYTDADLDASGDTGP